MAPSSCRCNKVMLTEGPSSLTARLCLESSLSISSSPNSTRDRWDATGLDGRVAAWERAGERRGELKALPISEAVSVLSLLGVGEGCEADVIQMPPVRPSVRTERGVFSASFLWTSFFSFSAKTLRAIWLSIPVTTRPGRDRRLDFRRNLKKKKSQYKTNGKRKKERRHGFIFVYITLWAGGLAVPTAAENNKTISLI